jgi:hypothetical protein
LTGEILDAGPRTCNNYDFGFSSAIWNDTAVVAAGSAGCPTGSYGRVFVFRRDGATRTWRSTDELTYPGTPVGGEFFGVGVGIYENTIVVASNGAQRNGTAWVFEKDSNNTWKHAQLGGLYSGGTHSCAITKDHILVGAQSDNTGRVFVFKKPTSGWTSVSSHVETQWLTYGKPGNSHFGIAIRASGDRAIVKSYTSPPNVQVVASMYDNVFGTWLASGEYIAQQPVVFYEPGGVDIHEDVAVIGSCPPVVWVLKRDTNGWGLAHKLQVDNDSQLGTDVALTRDSATQGRILTHSMEANRPTTYVFDQVDPQKLDQWTVRTIAMCGWYGRVLAMHKNRALLCKYSSTGCPGPEETAWSYDLGGARRTSNTQP